MLTGLGAVSCLGNGIGEFWNGLLSGGAEPSEVGLPHMNMRATKMYLVPEAAIPDAPQTLAGVRLGSGPRMAVAAARQALTDAGLIAADCIDMPVVLGVEMGNASAQEELRVPGGGGPRWSPLAVTAAAVSAAIGSRRGNTSVGNACAAGGYALGIALDLIRAGEADLVLVGGADGVIRVGMGGFDRLGAADPFRCRPFDRNRTGTVFGDGAAMAVLESAGHAARRGARSYAELAAAAWSCDAHHLTAPDSHGGQLIRATTTAMADAGLSPHDIGCVLPHGTGTPLNDAVESRALRHVFGEYCDRLPLFSLKAMIGHTSATAGMFACLTAALMLSHGKVPANTAIDQDPECEVWLPQDHPVSLDKPAVLVNAAAFGGNNASFILRAEGRHE